MIGIVIAAHGHLAQELASTAQQIVGELPHVSSCSVEPEPLSVAVFSFLAVTDAVAAPAPNAIRPTVSVGTTSQRKRLERVVMTGTASS